MEENKLISIRDFISRERKEIERIDTYEYPKGSFKRCEKYANLIGQNLSERYIINGIDAHPLNRFVPTDKDGNVLEEPHSWDDSKVFDEYQEAKERVLFDGDWKIKTNELIYEQNLKIYLDINDSWTIENLVEHDLTLTENAINQIK